MQNSDFAIVGVGSGGIEHLSLHGANAFQNADVVFVDADSTFDIHRFFLPLRPKIVLHADLDFDPVSVKKLAQMIASYVRRELRVVRLVIDEERRLKHLNLELEVLRKMGIRYQVIPDLPSLVKEAWVLQLPWLSLETLTQFQIIASVSKSFDSEKLDDLACSEDTLILDIGSERMDHFLDKLLQAGASPDRPVALVAYNPGRSPSCWLSTLEEIDELLPLWQTDGATILYIGVWPKTIHLDEWRDVGTLLAQ